MSTTEQNVLNLSIPSLASGGGSGGLNINYDFGPNVSAISDAAYSFLNGSFSQGQNFVNNAISGSQSFLSGLISPTVNAATAQINQNTSLLPQLYNTLSATAGNAINMSGALATQTLQTESQIAQSSIAASKSAAKSAGGGCFITTAVCEFDGLPDDCAVLEAFRYFRDEYMLKSLAMASDVYTYYRIAPAIVEKIDASPKRALIYGYLRNAFLRPAYAAIKAGQLQRAHFFYREMVDFAQQVTADG